MKPDFRLTDENAAAVAEICHRLDGLPLALELATARLNLFSPNRCATGWTSLKLLRGGGRDLPARQQTLRATIEWSYELLGPASSGCLSCSRRSRVRRSSRRGSGRAPTASGAQIDTLDGLASLVDQSLVRRVGWNGDPVS